MTELYLAAYLVIGIGWAVWTLPNRSADNPDEIRVFDFMSGVLAWLPEVLATLWLAAVHGPDWPDGAA